MPVLGDAQHEASREDSGNHGLPERGGHRIHLGLALTELSEPPSQEVSHQVGGEDPRGKPPCSRPTSEDALLLS